MEEYTIYLKVTNACNLKCKHCYNSCMNDISSMNDEVLVKAKVFIEEFAQKHINDAVNVQFHGGEPCLYDIKKLIEFVFNTDSHNIKYSITTNLVYKLTSDHLALFKKMLPYDDVPYIMTSWDPGIRFPIGKLGVWEDNVEEAIKNGIKVQPIVCVTKQLLKSYEQPKGLFKYFSEFGIRDMNFERITLTGRAAENDIKPTNREVDDWLFSAYLEYEKNGFHIPLFGNLKEAANGNLLGCRARKCMRTVLTINPDGSIATCPNMPLDLIGSLDGVDPTKITRLCMKERLARFQECSVCDLFKQCNGECCQLQSDSTGCPGLTKIIRHIETQRCHNS